MTQRPNPTSRAAKKTAKTSTTKTAVAKKTAKTSATKTAPAKKTAKTSTTKAAPAKKTAKTSATKTAPAKKTAKTSATKAAPAKKTAKTSATKAAVAKKTAKTVAEAVVETVVDEVADGVVETRGTAEWSDLNKRMFIQRMEIRTEIERLEAQANPANRRALSRLRREYETLTMKIIEANYGLLRKYVKLFTGSASREDARDFEAAGRLGLMRAIDNYDPYRGSFAQWAFKPIQREVLRAVHSADHNNMNPGDFERRPEILRALKKLQGENEEFRPTEAQVAAEAGVTIEQVKRVLHAPRMDSLHMPVGDGDAVLSDLIEDKSNPIDDLVINAIGVETLNNYGLSSLDAREYFVLSRRLGLDCEPEQRLSAIGDMLNLSREAVRQIEAKAVAKLSHPVLLRLLVRNGK